MLEPSTMTAAHQFILAHLHCIGAKPDMSHRNVLLCGHSLYQLSYFELGSWALLVIADTVRCLRRSYKPKH